MLMAFIRYNKIFFSKFQNIMFMLTVKNNYYKTCNLSNFELRKISIHFVSKQKLYITILKNGRSIKKEALFPQYCRSSIRLFGEILLTQLFL